jgi:hypothetical protein
MSKATQTDDAQRPATSLRDQYRERAAGYWIAAKLGSLTIALISAAAAVAILQELLSPWFWAFPIVGGTVVVVTWISVAVIQRHTVFRWDCAECYKRLETNIEWKCGWCGREHRTISVMERCACGKHAPGLRCYHEGCSHKSAFDGDAGDERCVATRIGSAEAIKSPDQEIQEIRNKISKLQVSEELAAAEVAAERRKNPNTPPSPVVIRQRRWDERMRLMREGVNNLKEAKRLRDEMIAETKKDQWDSDEETEHIALVEQWYQNCVGDIQHEVNG